MKQFKYYLDSGLSIESLSRHIGTNRSYLSLAIMYGHGCNFNTYVNRLRIKELLEHNHQTRLREKTFSDTALICGFNCKRTFNRAFFREKGLSPIDFVARYKRLPLQEK